MANTKPTSDEKVIQEARRKGFAEYFPAYPSFDAQQYNTAKAAREWLSNAPADCRDCANGIVHGHLTGQQKESK